jgi:hypothetical protein
MLTESWRSDKHKNAQELRDNRATELEARGLKVDTFDYDLQATRQGFKVYGLEAVDPEEIALALLDKISEPLDIRKEVRDATTRA